MLKACCLLTPFQEYLRKYPLLYTNKYWKQVDEGGGKEEQGSWVLNDP